jgi:excisionase family DNA binding protein
MSHNPDDDPTLTPEAVAERLGVSPSCVYKEIDRRRLPAHRLGQGKGVLRVSENQYRAYLLQTKLEQEEPPCPASTSSRTAASRSATKTSSEVSSELNALLTPAKKRKTGSPPSTATRRLVSSDTSDDTYSGKH